MQTKRHNTYKDVDRFFSKMLGKSEPIYSEIDFTLKDTNGNGYLYYPRSFWKVINTEAVKRMARILQTGTNIYEYKRMYHTRLEHCKGTYYRTLELLQNLYEIPEIKSLVDEKGYQKYIIAELLRALLHDIGHGPFSHTMETVCDLPKGFHEDIGFRLIKENKELTEALNAIYPDLPIVLEEAIQRDFLGLNRLFEGQIDVDRGDFLPRDSFFASTNYQENSIIASEMFNNVSIQKITDTTGRTRVVPVFEANQIGNLETFFRNRFNNYKNLYYGLRCSSYEYIFKAFADRLVNGKESFRLKGFLLNNMGKKPEEIDLQEYIQYDDVEYLKGIIEVFEKTKDPILRKLAMLSLPPLDRTEEFYLGLMISTEQVDENGNRAYTTQSDEEFIGKLGHLPDSKKAYEKYCIVLNSNREEDVGKVIQDLKEELHIDDEDLEKIGIISWKRKISSYKNKTGEETYIKGEDGKIYEYSVHPNRKAPILESTVSGLFLLIPLLEAKGYTQEQITRAIEIIQENNKKLEEKKHFCDGLPKS